MKEAVFHFPIEGTPVSCEQIKSGHINETFLITTDTGALYILQWINQYVQCQRDHEQHVRHQRLPARA